MITVLIILAVLGLLGALDNLLHHEWQTRLPGRISARRTLALHTARGFLYGVVLLGLAWGEWRGLWAFGFAALLAAGIVIALIDFLEEDASRRLAPSERILHMVLAAGYGAFLMALAPIWLGWAGEATAVAPVRYGFLSWLVTVYAVAVWASTARRAIGADQRFRKRAALSSAVRAADEAAARPGARQETVLVAGGAGFIATALVEDLLRSGKRVIMITRDSRRLAAAYGRRVLAVDHPALLPPETRIDAVVNLAGASIAGGLWTRWRKRRILEGRLSVAHDLIRFMATLTRPPKVLVHASATRFYGVRGPEALAETEPSQPIFMSQYCAQWERLALTARQAGTRVVILRFGLVLGRNGGFLPPLALAARLGLGAVLGNGRQSFPWIHIDDAVGLIRFAQEASALSGPVNAVAPDSVTQRTFMRCLAGHQHRGVHVHLPAFLLRLLMGEMSQVLLEGQNADPGKVLRAGYRFRHGRLEAALANLIPVRRQKKRTVQEGRRAKKRPGQGLGRAEG